MTDVNDTEAVEPAGISRRTAITGVAVGTGALWVAPALTTLGSRAFAATGSAAPSPSPTKIHLDYNYRSNGVYGHDYTIVTASDGTFTGTGTASDGPTETVTGKITNSHFSISSVYNNGLTYTVVNAPVTGNSFVGHGNIGGQNENSPVSGTFS